MTTASIRQKLHNYLEVADETKIKAIYSMVEGDLRASEVDYSDDFKAELDRRFEAYLNGTEKVVTAEESKQRIIQLLQQRR